MQPFASLVPMLFVASVNNSIAFYSLLGFEVGNTFKPVDTYPFYSPKGQFRVKDPDGYDISVSHT